MRHLGHLLALAAATLVGGTVVATTAHAQAPAGYYVAVPAVQPTRSTIVTRATPWSLKGNAYYAARAPERDTALCDAVARQAGQLSGFTVAGHAYDADQLARCNAHARGGSGTATAAIAR